MFRYEKSLIKQFSTLLKIDNENVNSMSLLTNKTYLIVVKFVCLLQFCIAAAPCITLFYITAFFIWMNVQ